MEKSQSKPAGKFHMPAKLAAFGLIWKELGRDPQAFRILMACTLAYVTTGLEPAFLTLSTSAIESQLRTPGSNAPMFVAVGFLIFAILTLIAGTTGDLFGRKMVLVAGLVGLTLANILGRLTLGTPQFAITDVLASITTLAVMPMCIAIITLTYPQNIRPMAYAMMFGSFFIAVILGASLGGIFDAMGIPNISFIPVVIVGIISIWKVVKDVPESRAPQNIRRTSAVANLILLAGVFWLVYLVITAQSLLNSWLPVLVAVFALMVFVESVRWLRRRVRFFKGVEVFTGRDIGFGIFAGVALFVAQGAFLYQFTAFFQDVQNMSVVMAGLAFAPFGIGILLGSFLLGRVALRYDARRIIASGFLIMGASLVWLAFVQAETSYWFMIVPFTLFGIGFGLGIPTRTQVVLSAPPPELAGSAGAINTAAGQSGYALGVVISSLLVTQLATSAFLKPLAQAGLPEATLQKIEEALPDILSQTSTGEYASLPQAVLELAAEKYDQALTTGMGQMFLLLAGFMLLSAAATYLGMHRGLKAASAPPLMQILPEQDEESPAEDEPVDMSRTIQFGPDLDKNDHLASSEGRLNPVLVGSKNTGKACRKYCTY